MPSPAWQRARVPVPPPPERASGWLSSRLYHPPARRLQSGIHGFCGWYLPRKEWKAPMPSHGEWIVWGHTATHSRCPVCQVLHNVCIDNLRQPVRVGESDRQARAGSPPPPHRLRQALPVLYHAKVRPAPWTDFSVSNDISPSSTPLPHPEDIHNRFFPYHEWYQTDSQDCKKLRCTACPHDPVPGHRPPATIKSWMQ